MIETYRALNFDINFDSNNDNNYDNNNTNNNNWVRQNAYYLRPFFISAGFTMSRVYWSRMLGDFGLWPPSWAMWYTWPRCHTGIDPMPDKMNLDFLKLLYCEFQK